ncbi:MAG TPA: M50 family metallopeptidase [Virgibacillus sp.]|nr:M50 family metallopeptidase [Virgibacillus sp.]
MSIYLLLFTLFIVAPIGTFIHESGHMLGAKFVKADCIKLSIGLGKEIGTICFKNVHITIHALFFLGGFVQSERHLPYKALDIFWITICGPMNNGIFALLFFSLNGVYTSQYIYILFLFNLWLAIINLIPYKVKDRHSDGYTILKTILPDSTIFK